MTSTSLEVAEVGHAHDDGLARHGYEHQQAQVAEELAQPRREARRVGAVDHAVVVGERERQDQPRHEARRRARPAASSIARDAEDRDLGLVDDRREEACRRCRRGSRS